MVYAASRGPSAMPVPARSAQTLGLAIRHAPAHSARSSRPGHHRLCANGRLAQLVQRPVLPTNFGCSGLHRAGRTARHSRRELGSVPSPCREGNNLLACQGAGLRAFECLLVRSGHCSPYSQCTARHGPARNIAVGHGSRPRGLRGGLCAAGHCHRLCVARSVSALPGARPQVGSEPARPNPSLESGTSTGMALGPRSARCHHPLRRPSAIPVPAPQLKR